MVFIAVLDVKTRQLHICSYNIHKGFGAGNRRFLLEDMRTAIRSADADICFLQEVVGHRLGYRHANTESQFEFLADSIWTHYAYGKNAIVDDGHHGNAILSKYPFAHWENRDISRWRFSSRGLLLGRLEIGVNLICAHLGLLASERRYQVAQLEKLITERCDPDEPIIVAGDFNDWRMQADKVLRGKLGFAEVIAQQSGRPARSFPAILPVLRMDRIYYRGLQLEEARLMRGGVWSRLSDHAALTASFRLGG